MKITVKELKNLIKEEINKQLEEDLKDEEQGNLKKELEMLLHMAENRGLNLAKEYLFNFLHYLTGDEEMKEYNEPREVYVYGDEEEKE